MRKLSSSPDEIAGYLGRRICSGAQAAILLCITQVVLDRMKHDEDELGQSPLRDQVMAGPWDTCIM